FSLLIFSQEHPKKISTFLAIILQFSFTFFEKGPDFALFGGRKCGPKAVRGTVRETPPSSRNHDAP
ncbi:MAG: hypothetical protein IKZ25_02625, partial [Clostridia bacterium]|nr:hypothetical protein [Clostridia bacterium]